MTATVAIDLITPLNLTGASTHFRQSFVEGDVPAGQYIQVDPADATNFSVTPHNYWPDGSLRGARVALRADFVANTKKRINLVKRSSAGPIGTVLTPADVLAGPAVVISCGAFGSVTLSAMLRKRTYVANKECITAIYAGMIGSDPHLWALVEATRYADGNCSYDVRIHHAFAGSTSTAAKTFVPSISVGGTVKYNNGGTAVTVYPYSAAIRATVWSGTNPQIRPIHDTGYLLEAVVAPNPASTSTAAPLLAALAAKGTYTPGDHLDYSVEFGSTGYQKQIGPMSTWDMQFFITKASEEAYDCMMAHARAINVYGTIFADATTFDPINYTAQATWGMSGIGTADWGYQGGGGNPGTKTQDGVTQLVFDTPHAPLPSSYLAHCVNDSYLDLETLVHICRGNWLAIGQAYGNGVNRRMAGQMRQRAWDTRTLGVTCSVLPDSLLGVFGDLKTHLKTQMLFDANYYGSMTNAGSAFGMVDQPGYDEWFPGGYAQTPALAGIAPFGLDFMSHALGWLRKLKPLDSAGQAAIDTYHNYLSRSLIFRVGTPGDPTQFNPGNACALYAMKFRSTKTEDGGNLVSQITSINPGQVHLDTLGVTNPAGIVLAGSSGGDPTSPTDYWAQFVGAFAWGKDLNVPNIAAKLAVVKTASNWNTTQGATDKLTYPNFNIVARSEYSQPRAYIATDSGSGAALPTPILGPTLVFSDTPLWGAGTMVLSPYRGLGTPLRDAALGGETVSPWAVAIAADGGVTSLDYEALTIPGPYAHGAYKPDEKLGGSYAGDGTYDPSTATYLLGGALLNQAALNFGTAPTGGTNPTVTGITANPAAANLAGGASVQIATTVNGLNNPSQSGTWAKVSGVGSVQQNGTITAPAATSSQQTGLFRFISTQDANYHVDVILTVAAATQPGDTTRPVMVAPITPSNVTSSGFTVSIQAATDNVAIKEYKWRLNGGTAVSTGLSRTKSYAGLTADSLYNVEVLASDTSDNAALTPLSIDITTLAVNTDPGPVLMDKVLMITLKSRGLVLRPNVTGIYWEWSDARGTVTSSGSGLASNALGEIQVPIRTALLSDGIGFLSLDNYTGGNPLDYFGFFGPVRVP